MKEKLIGLQGGGGGLDNKKIEGRQMVEGVGKGVTEINTLTHTYMHTYTRMCAVEIAGERRRARDNQPITLQAISHFHTGWMEEEFTHVVEIAGGRDRG